MKLLRLYSKEMEKLINRLSLRKKRLERTVAKIIEDVRNTGEEAVLKYTYKFDKVKLTPRQIRVSEAEITGAFQDIQPEFVTKFKEIMENIERFYRKKIRKSWRMHTPEGIILGEEVFPLQRVGIYIPGGTAPLVSTIYMIAIPARIAGVEEIVLATPPNRDGLINPYILVVANLLKIKEIYKMGGAQAIAALTLGTKTIKKVDKIFGPGNPYVTEAKRQVFGYVGIDMLAGPSEVVIIANRFSNPLFVIADLKAQAEHAGGLSFLITTSKTLAKLVRKELENGYLVLVNNLDEAIEVANQIAPEHLEILVQNPRRVIKRIRNAGCVFVGPYSPAVVGDYAAGPSHVLPTGGSARFFSALGVEDFMKRTHLVIYSKKALEKVKPLVEAIAEIEKMTEHIKSLNVRFA
ncbi:MAG: histidinol dehydrogenase [Candidatus Omnitrophica bacterium]|nr:histidinol dehydrogenase [Candidatus Omnitrophota bacterium]MCM8794046.1 histidinol dehydrogenase [Candidatus Omnitrophota bacterium]